MQPIRIRATAELAPLVRVGGVDGPWHISCLKTNPCPNS